MRGDAPAGSDGGGGERDADAIASYASVGAALSGAERALLTRLERDPIVYARGTRLRQEGEAVDTLYVVRDGWVISGVDLRDGRRHVVRTYHRGDILGLQDIAGGRATTALTACTDAVLCPFPRSDIAALATASPRLATLLLALSARDQVLLSDLLRMTGRLSAKERVAFLLLTYLCRLRASALAADDSFALGLDQSQIGDMVGLTNVSVSKAFAALEGDGLITRRRQIVTLEDVPRMGAGLGFVDRFTALDTSWFPPSPVVAAGA